MHFEPFDQTLASLKQRRSKWIARHLLKID
jgi:hypothetical protein